MCNLIVLHHHHREWSRHVFFFSKQGHLLRIAMVLQAVDDVLYGRSVDGGETGGMPERQVETAAVKSGIAIIRVLIRQRQALLGFGEVRLSAVH